MKHKRCLITEQSCIWGSLAGVGVKRWWPNYNIQKWQCSQIHAVFALHIFSLRCSNWIHVSIRKEINTIFLNLNITKNGVGLTSKKNYLSKKTTYKTTYLTQKVNWKRIRKYFIAGD